jgi:CubicO group peptidase (beta-lactamase class C family)
MMITKSQILLGTLLALITLTVPITAGVRKVAGQNTEPSPTQIDQYIRDQMAQKNIVGLSVAIVQNNEVTYLRGFGAASIKRKTQVTPQTIFDLASCSKSFTAMATLLLWNDGLIDLDQPLRHYIPEFQLEDEKVSDQITVRELLNQTSGLPGNFSEPVAYQKENDTDDSDTMKMLVAAVKRIHTDRPPGSSFEYTNLNYDLLGALVERISGQDFDDFVQERIFSPLGMNNSTLKPDVAAGLDRADGHQMMLGHIITRNIPIYHSAQPAGWVMSSAEDMAKWLLVNLNDGMLNGQQVIPSIVVQLMHKPEIDFTSHGEEMSYAMGWFVGQTGVGEPVIWHSGDTPNFLSEIIILPQRNLGVVMLVNSQTSRNAHSVALGITGLLIGSELTLPSSPWWASWAEIDHIALIALILALALIIGLVPYIWWQWRIIRRYHKGELAAARVRKTMKIWLFVLPATPWVFLGLIAGAAYTAAQVMFGFNLFITIVRFGSFAPPGIMVSAITIMSSLLPWMIALTITGYLRASARARVSNLIS